jgi:phosphoinositide-3-kinase regulatory subunit 4
LTTSTSSVIQQTPESPPGSEGLVILLNAICSFIPTLKYSSTKLAALELFSLFANYLNSEIRLQRIVPYIVHLLSEESALVRATAIRTLASVVSKYNGYFVTDT